MALDPNIPLMGTPPVNALELAKAQGVGMELRQRQQDVAAQDAIRNVFANPDSINPATGTLRPEAVRNVFAASPAAGIKLMDQMQAQELHRAQINHYNALTRQEQETAAQKQRDSELKLLPHIIDINARMNEFYDRRLAAGATPDQARQDAISLGNEQVDSLSSSGVLGGDPIINRFKQGVSGYDRTKSGVMVETSKSILARQKAEEAPPKMRTRVEGENEVQEQFNMSTGKWEEIGRGPRFARQVAPVVNVSAGSDVPALDDQTLDYAAGMYRKTGVMPPMGQGKAGAKLRQEIMTRAGLQAKAEGGDAASDVAIQRGVRADTASLTAVSKMYDAVESFTNTASANGKVLIDLAKKVNATGIPVVDRWVRAGRKELAGDPDVSAFNAQLRLYGNEIAKIATNPNLTGVLTVEAMREIDNIMNKGSTPQQIERLVTLLNEDAGRRKTAVKNQISEIKGRIKGGAESTGATPSGAPAVGEVRSGYRFKGGDPAKQESWEKI